MEQIHVGIDVAKRKFDLAIHEDNRHEVFEMNKQSINQCIRLLKEYNVALIVMEATGGYEHDLFIALAEARFHVAVVNPRKIRDFAKACGKLAKTDKIDASVIALFAAVLSPRPSDKPDEHALKIRAIAARRRQLVGMATAEKNRLGQARDGFVKQTHQAVIATIETQIAKIDEEMDDLIGSVESLRETAAIIKSVPGFGKNSASQIVADLPELGSLNRRELASLVGVAPINRDSGAMRGKRTTGGGRRTVRKTLYMPTLAALRWNPVIRAHYQNLLSRGKPKMVAITACMRKLLTILNALVAKNETWNPKTT